MDKIDNILKDFRQRQQYKIERLMTGNSPELVSGQIYVLVQGPAWGYPPAIPVNRETNDDDSIIRIESVDKQGPEDIPVNG